MLKALGKAFYRLGKILLKALLPIDLAAINQRINEKSDQGC